MIGFAAERPFTGNRVVVAVMEDSSDLLPKIDLATFRKVDENNCPADLLAEMSVRILTENIATYRAIAAGSGDRDLHYSMEDVAAAAVYRVANATDSPGLTYSDPDTKIRSAPRSVPTS